MERLQSSLCFFAWLHVEKMSQNIYHDVSQYYDFEDFGDFKIFWSSVLLTIREILERLERDSGDASWSPHQSDQSDQSAPALICTNLHCAGMPSWKGWMICRKACERQGDDDGYDASVTGRHDQGDVVQCPRPCPVPPVPSVPSVPCWRSQRVVSSSTLNVVSCQHVEPTSWYRNNMAVWDETSTEIMSQFDMPGVHLHPVPCFFTYFIRVAGNTLATQPK